MELGGHLINAVNIGMKSVVGGMETDEPKNHQATCNAQAEP